MGKIPSGFGAIRWWRGSRLVCPHPMPLARYERRQPPWLHHGAGGLAALSADIAVSLACEGQGVRDPVTA